MKKTILLIEDDPELRDLISECLADQGCHVHVTSNGKEALTLLLSLSRSELPDLILLDLVMPILNGQTFLHHLETYHSHDYCHIPIMIISGADPKEIVQKSIFNVGFLEKPFDLERLSLFISQL